MAHHVALSVVGTDRLTESGYFRAKVAQEKLITGSPIPYSIVHATQFFEFVKSIADAATDGDTVRLAPVLDPADGGGRRRERGRPRRGRRADQRDRRDRRPGAVPARRADPPRSCARRKDPREVVADPSARYFGAELRASGRCSPGRRRPARRDPLRDWLEQQLAAHSPFPQPRRRCSALYRRKRCACSWPARRA